MEERSKSKKRILKRLKRRTRLHLLSADIYLCTHCAKGTFIRGEGFGDPVSKIMLVGQSLHGECKETAVQIPFIGPMHSDSGDVLFCGIEAAGLRPEDLWITNIVKCHPPRNTPNQPEWEKACHSHFLRELSIVKPSCVVALGNQAHSAIYQRHKHHKISGVDATYCTTKDHSFYLYKYPHPSWAMRNGTEAENKWIRGFGKLLKNF